MYIIVVGGGKVGYYLTKTLVTEGYEVFLIEKNPAKCHVYAERFGAVVMQGDGADASILEAAGAGRADVVIAVTGDDEDNLVSCQVAKQRFNVGRTVARINNPQNEAIFRKLDVDITVSATTAILSHIEQELPTHQLIPLMRLKGSGLEIVEVRIPDDSRVVGRPLREILLPQQSMVALVIGEDGTPRMAGGDTVVRAGDEVVAVTMHDSEEALREALMAPPPARAF